jgi:hypothetical protein
MSISGMPWWGCGRAGSGGRGRVAVLLLFAVSIGAFAAPARANLGYELNAAKPSQSVPGILHGMAVDQTSRQIYVAVVVSSLFSVSPGRIDRFGSDFSAAGTFSEGSEPFYTGVAVNPATEAFYAAQSRIHSPFGAFGVSKMDLFSAAGVAGTPFALTDTGTLPQIAADAAGYVYYPNAVTHSVQVFDSTGTVLKEVSCAGCTGGAFGQPISVALDSAGDLYVVDLSPDRVVKLTPSGGGYAFSSILQSGRHAVSIGVDPSDDTVLVGDVANGNRYHIVAYDSSGAQFDDFGAGAFAAIPPGTELTLVPQLAADATSHKVYAGDKERFLIFNRVTATPPTATTDAATSVGQVSAILHATVNTHGHAALECEFEYTDDADFQANAFANALALPCSALPDGTSNTSVEAKAQGLTPSTAYHYRVAVTTNAGSVSSSGLTFETLPAAPPTVTMEQPQGITTSAATLMAKVNPHGGTVSNCHFEFGATSYETNLSCSKLPEVVTTDVAESRGVSNLTPVTTYHYRLVVTSNAGTTEGDDVEFTTAAQPPPPPPADPAPGNPAPTGTSTTPSTTTTAPAPGQHPLRCKKGFRKKRVRGKLRCVKKKRPRPRRTGSSG